MVSVVLKLETENGEVMNRMPTKTTKAKKKNTHTLTQKRNEVRLEKIRFSVILYLHHHLKKTEALAAFSDEITYRFTDTFIFLLFLSLVPLLLFFPFVFLHSVMTEMSRHGCGIAEVTHLPCT